MSRKKSEQLRALRQRVAELSAAIEDIVVRKRAESQRAHPSQEYIDALKFELRGFQAELETLERKRSGTPASRVAGKVISLAEYFGK